LREIRILIPFILYLKNLEKINFYNRNYFFNYYDHDHNMQLYRCSSKNHVIYHIYHNLICISNTVSLLQSYLSRCYLNIPNINVHTDDEISDGISVISDSEDHDHDHSDHNEESTEKPIDWNKEELKIGHKRKKLTLEQKSTESENFPLTPPTTPTVDNSNRLQIQTLDASEMVKVDTTPTRPQVNFKKLLFIGGVLTMLAAILINNYQLYNLKSRGGVDDFSAEHELRITELEIEKRFLRNEIERIKESLQGGEALTAALPTNQNKKGQHRKQQDLQGKRTEQKLVWSGQEDDPLVIPDNMFHLPDYCTKTYNANDELFNEYNKNLCEKIQKKIDERSKKSKNSKKLAKDLNNLRQKPKENAEIFVEIEDENVMENVNQEKVSDSLKKIKFGSSFSVQKTPHFHIAQWFQRLL
jgi:hypothetical protein